MSWDIKKGDKPDLPPYHNEETAKIAESRKAESKNTDTTSILGKHAPAAPAAPAAAPEAPKPAA